MFKRGLAIALCLAMAVPMLFGCSASVAPAQTSAGAATAAASVQPSSAASVQPAASASTAPANNFEKNFKISASCLLLEDGYDYQQDNLVKFYQQKYNVQLELYPVSWANWADKTKVWITSGDMPDITMYDINFTDYQNYAKQGLIKALPDDYAQKYPLLADEMSKTLIADFAKDRLDGKLYMVPKVVFYDKPADIITNHQSVWYRKDWAKKLGYTIGDTITYSQIEQMNKDFVSKDPGGNGPGNTVGLAGLPVDMLNMFMYKYDLNYNTFYKKDDAYVWGASEQGTLDGLKYVQGLYKNGTIYKDFYTAKSEVDVLSLLYSGKTGMIVTASHFGRWPQIMSEFTAANPTLNADDTLGAAVYTDDQGVYHGVEATNYYASSVFNPNLADDKFDRILTIMNDITSPESQTFIQLGTEGKDYTKNGNQITITRPKDDKGNFKAMADINKSFYFWCLLTILWDNFDVSNPAIPQNYRDTCTRFYQIRAKGDLRRLDFNLLTFSAPNFNKLSIVYQDEFTQLLLKDGDLQQNFDAWVSSKKPMIDQALAELNAKK